jgi:redox-sensitive bicupin YhaK (pirin superfamily)
VHGPAQTRVPITYVHLRIEPGASARVEVPPTANAFVYAFAGAGSVGRDRRALREREAAILAEGDVIEVHADADEAFEALVLAGAPLREPVARYGPFVMNTKQEIVDAFDDYQSGRFTQ